jgi:hypothetical protein
MSPSLPFHKSCCCDKWMIGVERVNTMVVAICKYALTTTTGRYRQKVVEAHEMLRDAQISEIIRMPIMDELIEDEVRMIWKEVDIESVIEVLIDGMIGIVKKAAAVIDKWTSFVY